MKGKSSQSGIALIMTLGVLSILLVLALGFASTSTIQKKAASNSASVTLARLIAESGVEKVLAGISYYAASTPNAMFDMTISHEEEDTYGNNENFDTLWRISTSVGGIDYYTWDSSTYSATRDDALHWQYVYNGKTGDDAQILGRYAYVVIPSGGKLDPSFIVSHNAGGDYPDGTAVDEGNDPVRFGKNVCEISAKGLVPSFPHAYMSVGNLTNLSSTAVGGGMLADGSSWVDIDTIFSAGKLNITNSIYD